MRWQLVERKGKRIREEVPLLHDLLFAHTTCACMDPIVEEISTLQYRYLRGGYRKPMTVGHAEMNRFSVLSIPMIPRVISWLKN